MNLGYVDELLIHIQTHAAKGKEYAYDMEHGSIIDLFEAIEQNATLLRRELNGQQ